MKDITFTVKVPDETDLSPLLLHHAEILQVLGLSVAHALNIDISEVFTSLEATVPVTHPRRLGVITGITREGL
jgi:hypothetical protein